MSELTCDADCGACGQPATCSIIMGKLDSAMLRSRLCSDHFTKMCSAAGGLSGEQATEVYLAFGDRLEAIATTEKGRAVIADLRQKGHT